MLTDAGKAVGVELLGFLPSDLGMNAPQNQA
jgi:hypothetical protein